MYDLEEMKIIADLCKKYDVIVISDDVYEWLVYPGCKFIKMGKMCVPLCVRDTDLTNFDCFVLLLCAFRVLCRIYNNYPLIRLIRSGAFVQRHCPACGSAL